jgi:phospholipid/cholesterol/gamma-HCH transport system substrate-binding protein
MTKPSLAWKVGLFVCISLVMIAGLAIEFSKGMIFFEHTNTIYLHAPDVAGLKSRADVLMSGVKVGSVAEISLEPGGKSATLALKIYTRYQIRNDARFVIQPSGLLGDEYVAIIPTENKGPVLEDGASAQAEAPFNLEEFARSAGGLIERLDKTADGLGAMIGDVRKYLLNEQTLTNFSAVANNLRAASERALTTMNDLGALVSSNGPALSQSGSNLVAFSDRMDQFAGTLNAVVATNRTAIAAAVKNLDDSTEILKGLLGDVQAGKGLAGTLLKNEQLAANVSLVASNLSVTTSNLNRLGLWGVMWRHKPPKPSAAAPPERLASPKESDFSE